MNLASASLLLSALIMFFECSCISNAENKKANRMVGCIKKVTVIPGKEQEFECLFNELKAEVALLEPGNEYYHLYKSDSGDYVVMERYRDKAALTEHEKSAHGARFFPKIRALLASLERECFESID